MILIACKPYANRMQIAYKLRANCMQNVCVVFRFSIKYTDIDLEYRYRFRNRYSKR